MNKVEKYYRLTTKDGNKSELHPWHDGLGPRVKTALRTKAIVLFYEDDTKNTDAVIETREYTFIEKKVVEVLEFREE